jgi:hypothetical protein
LTLFIPPAVVDDVLAITDRDEQRFRALPSRLGVYFVLALCLWRAKSGPAVLRAMIPLGRLAELARWGWRLPCSAALTRLRDRIGAMPLQLLFAALTRATPTRVRPWSHAFGLLVCAWDGTEITVADTVANRAWFGRHQGKKKTEVGVPKARLLVLVAAGSRQIIAAVSGTLSQGETTLAHQLLDRLRPGMLLLADRNFLGHPLWTAARGRGRICCGGPNKGHPCCPCDTPCPTGPIYPPSTTRPMPAAGATTCAATANAGTAHPHPARSPGSPCG